MSLSLQHLKHTLVSVLVGVWVFGWTEGVGSRSTRFWSVLMEQGRLWNDVARSRGCPKVCKVAQSMFRGRK